MVKVVIFDLDDTLYDEISYCKSGFKAVASCLAQSHPALRDDEVFGVLWSEFMAGNRRETFNKAFKKLAIPSDRQFIKSIVEVYRQHAPEITLPAQSRELLDELSGKYQLALLTDGFLPAQQLKVQALEIERYFKCIVYTEALGREFWKPSPVGFEKICRDLAVAPENCVYIGDNLRKDFIAPNKLSFAASLRVIRPHHLHDYKAPSKIANPTHTIDNLNEIAPLLQRL